MSKSNRDPSEILDTYLTQLQTGEVALDDILEQVSQEEDLRALLTVAYQARQALQPPGPNADFVRNSELRLLNRLRARRRENLRVKADPPRPWSRRLRAVPVLLSITLVLAMLFGTFGLVSASAASLPGDGLYPLKRGLEEARLALTFGAAGDVQLLSEYSDERLREIEALTAAGRIEDLDGAVEAYIATVDRLIENSQDTPSTEGVEENINQQIEALQGVQAKVPPQAQAAIQKAIDRSSEHAQKKIEQQEYKGDEQESRREEQDERRETREQDRDLRHAEQLARKYDITSDEVLALFGGICEQNWKCVRDHYRAEGE
jgi:hypothetical protein